MIKKLVLKSLLLIGIILLPFFTQQVFACSCWGMPTPYASYKNAKAVFVGKVVGVQNAAGKELPQEKEFNLEDLRKEPERYYRFAIQESLKGLKSSEVIVYTPINNCQFGFGIGESYLVYAYESEGVLETSLFCSRTKDAETAQGDIHFLRGLLENKPEPRIYGSVRLREKDPVTGYLRHHNFLEGIKIIAEGRKKRFETVTDKNGLYSFSKLPNGKYKVYPDLPNKYALDWFFLSEINLKSTDDPYQSNYRSFTGRSAYSEFELGWNNHISGKVLDAEGKPLNRANVELIAINQVNKKSQADDRNNAEILSQESPEGKIRRYTIGGYTPGKYVLAAEVFAPFVTGSQNLRIYYPLTNNPETAEIIDLKGFDKRIIDLKLPAGFIAREIEGELFWYDGTPVIFNGSISLNKLENNEDPNNVVFDAANVKEGRFKIQAFENAEYWIHAEALTKERLFGESKIDLWEKGIKELKAKPVKLRVGKINGSVKIIIPLPENLSVTKQ